MIPIGELPIETVPCGAVEVSWLSASTPVPEALIDRILTPEDQAFAATLHHLTRRKEFSRSRCLIRTLSQYSGTLAHHPEGDLIWPAGLRGSLTHKDGVVAVALVGEQQYSGLGIDAETVAKVRPTFEPRLAKRSESQLLDQCSAALSVPRAQLLALLFSFKESLFKCHFPLGRRMFYFLDAEVIAIADGEIQARVLKDTSPATPAGHITKGSFVWKMTEKGLMVLTVAILPS